MNVLNLWGYRVYATLEAVEENEGCTDKSIGFDKSWQKRGHILKSGYATDTSFDAGKAFDLEILSR